VGLTTSLLICHNDFWGNLFLSDTLDLPHFRSYYNPFFPFGYTLLLKGISSLLPALAAPYVLNLILASLLSIVIMRFASYVSLNRMTNVMAVLLVYTCPMVLDYLCSPGPDVGALLFFNTALLLCFVSIDGNGTVAHAVGAGALFGVSALFRYHALPSGALFLLAVLMISRKTCILYALGALLLVYSPQLLLNILVGGTPLQSHGEYYVYNLIHGLNWYHIGSLLLPHSPLGVIIDAPLRFAVAYSKAVARMGIVLVVPPILCFSRADNDRERRACLVWTIFTAGYVLMTALGGSPRAILIPLPMSIVFAVAYVKHLNLRRFRIGIAPVLIAVLLAFALADTKAILKRRKRSACYRQIEHVCRENGVSNSRSVYTTDFDLYFRGIKPYRGTYNGGWLQIGTYRGRELNPQPRLDSLGHFLHDCRVLSIRMIHLTPGSHDAAAFLWEFYRNPQSSTHLTLVSEVCGSKVYVLREQPTEHGQLPVYGGTATNPHDVVCTNLCRVSTDGEARAAEGWE
jgi:hypothetical protein